MENEIKNLNAETVITENVNEMVPEAEESTIGNDATESVESNVVEIHTDDDSQVENESESTDEENKNLSSEDIRSMLKTITDSLKTLEGTVKILEEQWMAEAREFNITDTHMKELGKWNSDHRVEIPADATEEVKKNWDYLNGIDTITMDEIKRIFGDDSPIHGMSEDITKGRVKEVCEMYFGWLMALREYRDSHDAYLELLEMQEEAQIESLQARADAEEDPDKKKALLDSIDQYYNFKYLGFLREPLSEKELKRLLDALDDEQKCTYWLNRTRDRLRQYKVSPQFIMEIAGFEKRFDKDYSSIMNILLLYFTNICIHSDPENKKDPNNTKTFSMVIAIDDVIRNVWKGDKAQRVLDNIEAFLDQFIEYKKANSPEVTENNSEVNATVSPTGLDETAVMD